MTEKDDQAERRGLRRQGGDGVGCKWYVGGCGCCVHILGGAGATVTETIHFPFLSSIGRRDMEGGKLTRDSGIPVIKDSRYNHTSARKSRWGG